MRETYFDKLKKQGAVEAMQNVLSRQLQTKFGPLPEVVIAKIRKIE